MEIAVTLKCTNVPESCTFANVNGLAVGCKLMKQMVMIEERLFHYNPHLDDVESWIKP
jgi:hypothetical protein